jgi:hypothetical protein
MEGTRLLFPFALLLRSSGGNVACARSGDDELWGSQTSAAVLFKPSLFWDFTP